MAFVNLGQIMYPVGSYYISNNSTSPATLFGGSWAEVTGKFLYANKSNTTGGSNTNKHKHDGSSIVACLGAFNNDPSTIGYFAISAPTSPKYNIGLRGSAIGGESIDHNNHATSCYGYTKETSINIMPAYQSVYCWRRTA